MNVWSGRAPSSREEVGQRRERKVKRRKDDDRTVLPERIRKTLADGVDPEETERRDGRHGDRPLAQRWCQLGRDRKQEKGEHLVEVDAECKWNGRWVGERHC